MHQDADMRFSLRDLLLAMVTAALVIPILHILTTVEPNQETPAQFGLILLNSALLAPLAIYWHRKISPGDYGD